jgi:hypothetical protein
MNKADMDLHLVFSLSTTLTNTNLAKLPITVVIRATQASPSLPFIKLLLATSNKHFKIEYANTLLSLLP